MSDQYDDHTSSEAGTAAIRAELLDDLDTPVAAGAPVPPLPSGTAAVLVTRGPNAGTLIPLDQSVISAGRHPTSKIFLDDVLVSRRHAEFRRAEDGFEVVDMGSLNGTYVNGEPLHSGVTLVNGDEIAIGKYRLKFFTGPEPR